MYPQCKAENRKRSYRNSYATPKSAYYAVEANDYSSRTSSLILNLEDNDNLIEMPNRFQQETNVLKEPQYENDGKFDEDIDFLLNNDSSYQLQCCKYLDHDQNQPCCQSYQRNRRYNHNHQNYNFDFGDDVSLQFNVHQGSINKNNSGNNNNNDTNSFGKLRGRYGEDYKYQPLPTVEWLQLKPLDHISSYSIRDKRNQFYSDFYNYNNQSSKLPERPGRGRRLPNVLRIPISTHSVHSREIQMITRSKMSCVKTQQMLAADAAGGTSDIVNNPLPTYRKAENNNTVLENGNWLYDSNDMPQSETTQGDFIQQKNYEFNESKNLLRFDEECIETSSLYLQKYKNRVELRPISAESNDNIRRNTQISVSENLTKWKIVNKTNICDETRKTISKNEIYLKNIKLPITSSKANVSSAKKCSPPAKNRRVLLYNIQSPTLSRLSSSNLRSQKLKHKHNVEFKDQYDKHVVFDSRKLTNDNISKKNGYYESYKNIVVNSSGDNEYDDMDNDSDNSSCSDNSSDSEEDYRSNAYKMSHSINIISTPLSFKSLNTAKADVLENPDALLVPSLFPNVPPYLAFSSNTAKGPDVPSDLYRVLKWRVTNVMPRVVRSILTNSGMRLLKKTNEWMGVWGKHMKSPCFKIIRPYQKVNHLPGSFKIGRKDSCWKNLVRLMEKHGKKEFGFMPKTYIIPNDLKKLRKSWPRYAQKNVKWIIKPPAGARGTGIRVVDRWAQIPKRKALIVQKYIERPLLINGSKFDLRLYVLVTSINPLRVYMYHNGLARFASVKYSDKSDTLNDRCMHLTNYSINKFSSNYSKNEDVYACHGHKWTIKSLWAYLSSRGVRIDLLWAALKALVLRTILAGENSINNLIRANVESKYSCFELFGFDVLLDADLVPWLLEVNISPSLHSELPLDSHVKAPLVQCVLNTALYNIPPRIPLERQIKIAVEMSLPAGPICYDKRLYSNHLSRNERIKHNTFTRKSMEERDEYVKAILENLTPDDVRCLVIAEDELARCSPLERIFPTVDTFNYLKYTEAPRYYNRLLDAWETRFASNRIEGIQLLREYCEDQYHLQVTQIPTKKDFLAKFLRWVLKS